MAKTRVSELAKTYGIPSKEALEKLGAIGEFAKSLPRASSCPPSRSSRTPTARPPGAAKPPLPRPPTPAAEESAAPKPGPKPRRRPQGACRSPRRPLPEVVETSRGRRGTGRADRTAPRRRPAATVHGTDPEVAHATAGRADAPRDRQQPVRAQPGHGTASRAAAVERTPALPSRDRPPRRPESSRHAAPQPGDDAEVPGRVR